MAREWQSSEYHRLSDPQLGWGRRVIERLRANDVPSGAHILDAGCGTGRVTAELLRRFPDCRVIAIDASANMVSDARSILAEFGGRVEVKKLDLLELPYENQFDLVFSTAVFHWIKDHARLFANLFRALRAHGLLHAQCGGGPNLEKLRKRIDRLVASPKFSSHLKEMKRLWEYPGPELTAERLGKAGFVEVETDLEETPVHLPDEQNYRDFITSVIVHPYLERMPPDLGREFVEALVRASQKDDPPFVLDYWRLNMRGRKRN